MMKYLTQKHISWVFTVFIVVLLLNCVCLPSAVAATSTWDGSSVDTDFQGSGTSESPYLITSAAELAGLAAASQTERFIGIYFQLTTSVDLGAGNWTPIGNARNPFEGFFDGGYHTISNLTFGGPENYIRFLPADPLYDPYGLFSQVEGGVLENLYLKNVGIYSNNKMVGGLVGRINSKDEEENLPGIIKNCYVSGVVSSNFRNNDNPVRRYVGGLAGNTWASYNDTFSNYAKVYNCCSTATVSVQADDSHTYRSYVAGLVALVNSTFFDGCYAAGNVITDTDGYSGILLGSVSKPSYGYQSLFGSSDATMEVGGVSVTPVVVGTESNTYQNQPKSRSSEYLKSADCATALRDNVYGSTWTTTPEDVYGGYVAPFLAPMVLLDPPDDKTFAAQAPGYAAQTPYSVAVSNPGTFATDALSVALSGDNASSFALSKTSLPALASGGGDSFTVVPNTGLGEGEYTATVTVSGSNIESKSFDIRFTVFLPTYTIAADPASLDFGKQPEGFTPAAKTVDIENTGNSPVTVTLPTNAAFEITTGDSLTLAAGGTATVSVTPKSSLTIGTHDTTLTFNTDHATHADVSVKLTVEAPSYTVEASSDSLDFGTKVEGYSSPPALQTVDIKNTGNLPVVLTLPIDNDFDISTADSLDLAPNATARVTVRPKTGRAVGMYDPVLVFSTDHETSVNVGTSFTVDAPNYTISANPTSLDFGAKVEGYSSPPDAQTVDITNTGNLSVTLTLPTNANYDIATGDPLTLAPNATATVSIQPKTGLAAGTYDPVLVFSTDHETSVNVGTSFTVENSNYTIEANKASLDFGTSIEGYSPPPAVQTVEIKNSGNLSVDLTLPTNANYDIATGDSLTLAPNATATVNVRPKEGLSPGTYDPTLRFTTNHATSADVDVTFTVIDAVYSIAAEPAAKDFGNATIGYAPIAPITVRVTNTGNKIVTLTQPAGVSYTVGSLSKTVLNPADFATFDLGPNTGLPVGTYPETVTISGSNDTRATVDLAFTVDPVLYGTSGSDTHYLNTGSHLIITSDGRFSDFQGVTVDGIPLTDTQFGAEEGSTIVTLYAEYLNTLDAGSHTFRMLFEDGYAELLLQILSPAMPDTGDDHSIVLYLALVLAAFTLAALFWRRRIHR